MPRTTELLQGPMKEVRDEAALLQVERLPLEKDAVFRVRVAYALLIHARSMDGMDVEKLEGRLAWWTEQAKLGREPLCYGF